MEEQVPPPALRLAFARTRIRLTIVEILALCPCPAMIKASGVFSVQAARRILYAQISADGRVHQAHRVDLEVRLLGVDNLVHAVTP